MLNQLVNKEKKHLFKKTIQLSFVYLFFISKKSQLTLAIKKHGLLINFFLKNTILTYGKYFPYVCTGKL